MCHCFEARKSEEAKVVQNKDRSCTDVLFLVLYALSWVVIGAIFADARDRGGDPQR
jgi:hypothetical protein